MAIYFSPHAATGAGAMGESIGKSLAQTLNMLTQRKMQQQQRKQRFGEISEGLQSLGVPAEMAQGVSRLPEKQQALFMQQLLGSEAFGAPQQQAGLGQMLGGQQQQQPVEQQQGLGQLLGGQQQQVGQGADADYQALQNQVQQRADALSPEEKKQLKVEIGEMGRINALPPDRQKEELSIPANASREARPGYRLQARPTRKKTFQELLATPRPSAADKKRAEDMLMKQAKLQETKQSRYDKNTAEYHKEAMKLGKSSRETRMRLSRMKELNEKGDLPSAGFASVLDTAGKVINLSSLMSADAQEFDKLSKDFLKGAKAIFGSRVTEGEIKLFLKTVPTLSQTQEGRRRIIRNMTMLNKGGELRKKAMLEIMDMNGGERPLNLEALVEKKVGPELDKIANDFAVNPGAKSKKQIAPLRLIRQIVGGLMDVGDAVFPSSAFE